jgi:hypothetical protein
MTNSLSYKQVTSHLPRCMFSMRVKYSIKHAIQIYGIDLQQTNGV